MADLREVELNSAIQIEDASYNLNAANGFGDKTEVPMSSRDRCGDMAAGHHGFKGASFSSAVLNLSTSIIGAGIMALPATMKALGIPLGVIFLILIGIFTAISVEILVRTTTVQKVWTYSDLVQQECGNRWRWVLDISILINNIGICTVYLIIIADVLCGTYRSVNVANIHEGLLVEWNGGQTAWWTSRVLVLFIITIVILLPLVSLRHVDSLHYSSAASIALAVIFVIITIIITVINISFGTIQSPRWLPNFSTPEAVMAVFACIPIMATAFSCQFALHPIYIELKDRTEENMVAVSRTSLSFTAVVYLLTAVCGYLLFGDATASDVLVNFDHDIGMVKSVVVNDIVRIVYVLHIILVFPVIFYSMRHIIDDIFYHSATTSLIEDHRRFWIITGAGIVATWLFAAVIPNIWVAFSLSGATTTMLLGVVFPAMLALKDKSGTIVKWEKKFAYFMIAFAVVVSITGITSAIYSLVQYT